MRASRLLRMLLLLQNSGRMTSQRLAETLEVTARTILRDVDALTEAGLPMVVHQGNRGGIELGFNYRTRLTGLSSDEAEAMAVILTHPVPDLAALGLTAVANRARSKMLESFPDSVRVKINQAVYWYQFQPALDWHVPDERVAAWYGSKNAALRHAWSTRSRCAIGVSDGGLSTHSNQRDRSHSISVTISTFRHGRSNPARRARGRVRMTQLLAFAAARSSFICLTSMRRISLMGQRSCPTRTESPRVTLLPVCVTAIRCAN